jgi:hypothetical protein
MNTVRHREEKLQRSAKSAIVFLLLFFAARSEGQTGALRGSTVALTNGTNTISIAAPSGLLESYSMTLPTAQSGANLYLGVQNGVLAWGTPANNATGSGGLLIAPATEQTTTHNNQYLFNVQYAPGSVGPLPGAVLLSSIDNPNPNATTMTVKAKNSNKLATGVSINGIVVNVTNSGTGIETGICSNAVGAGPGPNYSMIITGTDGTLCGIGTTTPTEDLEVTGHQRTEGFENK